MNDLVLLEIAGPVARLILNRPDRHNSLIPELLEEMLARLSQVRLDKQVRVLILAANGRSFSTGGDVRGFYEHLDTIVLYSERLLELLNETILSMLSLPVPVIAAVHGIVTGGSLGLVLAADIVLVTPQASFTPYYSVVGFSPDGGWTALLPTLFGSKRVAEVLMTNRTITAEQALDWGLANRLVQLEEIQAEAFRVAELVASMKPGSLRSTRALLNGQIEEIKTRLDAERSSFVKQIQSAEARQGLEAFLQM
jgi:2-(1,2-epoxy-1,2-dihydrophenyl)acetyl-CoA isomerase